MTRRHNPAAALVAVLGLLAAMLWALAAPPAPAHAAARVTIANELGDAKADTTYSTEITVSGSGFQSVQGAFGGVYLFFGTVGDGWRPSKGGTSGKDFRYVPDTETQDNAGFQRFVAFPGSSTQSEAHTTMTADGAWTVTMTVPGPTFQTVGRSGGTETIDCRTVTCGVITVGAHGVTNANNETFTPVAFGEVFTATPEPTAPPADGEQGSDEETGEGGQGEGTEVSDDETPAGVPTEPTLDVDRATAVVGRVMTFTAQGFTPGEQVVGSLGAGLAAVGPLVAGAQGEVAGVLQLPPDLKAGTHTLSLTSAATSVRAEVTFQVAAAPASPAPPVEEPAQGIVGWPWEWIGLGLAALVLAVVVDVGAVTAVRERRARRARATASVPVTQEPAPLTPVGAAR
ncbi:MAG: hypothetical protein GX593_03305 [Actinomycetales bacterium]|nr:hypothetical protein [Actinomycetales bacterium]